MADYTVGLIVGSVSEPSLNRRFAEALVRLAPGAGLVVRDIPIAELPFYGAQYDKDFPTVGRAFKDAIEKVDGLLIVTPEYNRSIPGVLKNAIDLASRPYGDSAFAGLPAAVIGASVGAIGTAMAQQHLRNILSYLDMAVMPQPEAYLQFKDGLVDADGRVTRQDTREFLEDFVDRFVEWIDRQRR